MNTEVSSASYPHIHNDARVVVIPRIRRRHYPPPHLVMEHKDRILRPAENYVKTLILLTKNENTHSSFFPKMYYKANTFCALTKW